MPTASCSICFEDLLSVPNQQSVDTISSSASAEEPEKGHVSATPCGHVFHTQCVLQWIQQHNHCPQCRRPALGATLVKLFLAEDQPSSLRRAACNDIRGGGSSGRSDTFIVVTAEEKLKRVEEDREESRIIQDVLQCQLEDLEAELLKLRKQLTLTEDQLQDKVQEVSGLEADLIGARRREIDLEKCLVEASETIGRMEEREGRSEMRDRVCCLREEARQMETNYGEAARMLQEKVAGLEAELRLKTEVVGELQSKLDRCNNSESAHSSIYESVEDLRFPRRKKPFCLNFCSCLKSTFIIVCLLAVILGVFVALPLKLIFADERDPSSKAAEI